MEYLVLGVCWLLLCLPVSVFLGKCIGFGQAGETARHAAAAATQEVPEPGRPQGTDATRAPSAAALSDLPAQRQATVGASR